MVRREDEQLPVITPELSKYPLPDAPAIVTVTHDMAGDWLDNRCRPGTAHQRKMIPSKINQYSADMDAGLWMLTPQGLIFDLEGWCIDGQNRLQAFRNSKLTELDFWVYPDQSATIFPVLDAGARREARQLFTGQYSTLITSAPRYLGEERGRYITTMTPQRALREVDKWPELATHARLVQMAQQRSKIPGAAHLAVIAQAERSPLRHMIQSWFDGVIHGLDLSYGDPRRHVRERFNSARVWAGRRKPETVYNTLAKAWNAHAKGEKIQTLAWREDEGMIPILGTE